MFTTREYTRLVGNGCDDVTIKPNVEFKAFEGDYTVTCYALIKDTESDEVIILKPGDKIKGIGKVSRSQSTEEMSRNLEKFIDNQMKEAKQKPAPKRRKRKVTDGI